MLPCSQRLVHRLYPVSLGTSLGSPAAPCPGTSHGCRGLEVNPLLAPRLGASPVTTMCHRRIWPHVKVGWPGGPGSAPMGEGAGAGAGQTWSASPACAGLSCISQSLWGLILPWCWRAAGPESHSHEFLRLSLPVPQDPNCAEPLLGLKLRAGAGGQTCCLWDHAGTGCPRRAPPALASLEAAILLLPQHSSGGAARTHSAQRLGRGGGWQEGSMGTSSRLGPQPAPAAAGPRIPGGGCSCAGEQRSCRRPPLRWWVGVSGCTRSLAAVLGGGPVP